VCGVLWLAVWFAASTDARGQEGPTVAIEVRDAASMAPVAGARGPMDGRTATASDQGRLSFADAAAGPRAVTVTADGYHPVQTTIDVGAGSVSVEVLLTRRGLKVTEAVIVVASRAETREATVPWSTTVVDRGVLDERAARTAPEMLQDQSGGWVQKTNHGGGSPFLRGLVGNQVLVLIDGVRLNNATFRLGPNQYMNTIDAYAIDRLEVVRGGGSVLYGSDALGGVVNVVTPGVRLSDGGVILGGAIAARGASGGMERTARAEGSIAGSKAGLRAGVTWRSFGDLVAGGTLGVEAPSAYDEADVDATGLWAPTSRTQVKALFQHVHQSDVPRFDQVAQRGYAVYAFDPQVRRLGYVRVDHRVGLTWLDSASVTTSWHRSEEGRVRQRRGSSLETREHDTVSTAGVSADLAGRLAPHVSWQGGIDVYYDTVRSRRRDTNLSTGTASDLRGLYPDGATRGSASAFLKLDASAGRWGLEAGTRYTRDEVRADDAVFGPTHITPDAFVGSVAARYDAGGGVWVFGSVSQAFRAPNIDDLSTLGAFDFGVEVPPGNLAPERSLSVEAGVKLRTDRVVATATAYRTGLDDLIDRERGTFDGSSVLDGQDVYRRANVGRAYVTGVDADVEWRLGRAFTLFGFCSAAYGQQTSAGVPMRRIPPVNGLAGIRHRWARGAWVETTIRIAAAQHRLNPGDVSDHRIPPGGTAGWAVANAAAAWPLGPRTWLTGGVANLFDRAYRVHGSGVDGAGRHAWLAIRTAF
jgi:outer membrane receptor protein involved in Fe transport